MGNILKAWLRKNHLAIDPTDYNAQVVVKGNIGVTEIVDELISEGLNMKREDVLDVISRFNRKSADLALSGYNVNNGLVSMRSFIKGPLNGGKWNPNVNWVDVTITHGKDLYQAVAETTVEILGEKDEPLDAYNFSDQKNQLNVNAGNSLRSVDVSETQLKTMSEPACGMAFRRWLCKA